MTPSAKTYNIIAGHMLAMGAGFFSLWVFGAWNTPKATPAAFLISTRLWCAVLSVVITTAATLALKAGQPASLATALLVSLGFMQTKRDAAALVIAVLIIAAIGEPLCRYSAKARFTDKTTP
ncbi:MAG: HPP family protein [Candidatus Sulfotelmatobacter sp.]